jgi:hypothetical protein
MSDSFTPDFSDLVFVRLFTPDHIPRYLIEQYKHAQYTPEQWYAYQRATLTQTREDGTIGLNPFNLLYAIRDGDFHVKGVLWCNVNPLDKMLFIDLFSIDPEYWHKGKAMELASNHVKQIVYDCKLNGVYWITRSPKHSEKYGFTRSRHTLMEMRADYGSTETDRVCIEPAGEPARLSEANAESAGRPRN